MRKRRWTITATAVLVTAIAIAAGLAMAGSSQGQGLTKVTLQSKWVVQSQFAGYYAAKAKGYYKQAGLDVNIKAGGPDILPEQVVLGQAGRVRDQLDALDARAARHRERPRQHRPGLRA